MRSYRRGQLGPRFCSSCHRNVITRNAKDGDPAVKITMATLDIDFTMFFAHELDDRHGGGC